VYTGVPVFRPCAVQVVCAINQDSELIHQPSPVSSGKVDTAQKCQNPNGYSQANKNPVVVRKFLSVAQWSAVGFLRM